MDCQNDPYLDALAREDAMSTTPQCQRDANAFMRNLYLCAKNKRTSVSPTVHSDLQMELMLNRIADPSYRFSVKSLREE